jgi:hypothetical protein
MQCIVGQDRDRLKAYRIVLDFRVQVLGIADLGGERGLGRFGPHLLPATPYEVDCRGVNESKFEVVASSHANPVPAKTRDKTTTMAMISVVVSALLDLSRFDGHPNNRATYDLASVPAPPIIPPTWVCVPRTALREEVARVLELARQLGPTSATLKRHSRAGHG